MVGVYAVFRMALSMALYPLVFQIDCVFIVEILIILEILWVFFFLSFCSF